MNKITQYLNEHLLGEVISSDAVRERFSRDGSILAIKPEIVVHPRVTNDIRKVARFAWQLAEKGHILPITVRGGGSNKTGAAIGKGIVINTLAHLNKVIFIGLKNKDQFIHLQPGMTFKTANETLQSNGLYIPAYPTSPIAGTIGGAIANNSIGLDTASYGSIGDWVTRLEVVLANGDLIETSRISRRDLNKKKGLQTFEGEIYRKLDGIIEDNQQTIEDKIANTTDSVGYAGIARVKGKDGSFDLTPLIVGSQGTLGIISEAVLKTDFYSSDESILVATFESAEMARDAADVMVSVKPSILNVIDSEIFDNAHALGKKYVFSDEFDDGTVQAVLYASFNDFSDHARNKKLKSAIKKLSGFKTTLYSTTDYTNDELQVVKDVQSLLRQSTTKREVYPSIIDGVAIPSERREEFTVAVSELAQKHHVSLPLYFNWLNGAVYTAPEIDLNVVADRQKTFKLISDYMELVVKFGGDMAADAGEGRLRAMGAYAQLDDDELDIYKQIKDVFDPFGILNPGVKQKTDLKTLISELDPKFDNADLAPYSPRF